MNYCLVCGCKLEKRFLKNEGDIPFCKNCDSFRFPVFNAAVSMLILNQSLDKLLLIQQYQKKDNILVAGYINQGERAEDAVAREVSEEVGLTISNIVPNQSQFYQPSNTLILNYSCVALQEDISLTDEVDKAQWFELDEAIEVIKPNSLAKYFLKSFLAKHHN